MRRKIERRITVSINKDEVLAAAIRMARCPPHCRKSAVVDWVNGTVQIAWIENSDTNADGTPKARMLGRTKVARSDRIEMVGKTYGGACGSSNTSSGCATWGSGARCLSRNSNWSRSLAKAATHFRSQPRFVARNQNG